jgi:hypothetical protein
MKRFLIVAVLLTIVAVLVRQGRARRNEWHGLTEAEARARLEQRFPGVIPEERRDAMTDTIVAKMRDRGVITDEPETTTSADETIDLTESAATTAEADTADSTSA